MAMRNLVVILAGLLIAACSGDASICSAQNADSATGATTAAADRQRRKITAPGTIEPMEVVDVGSQVNGTIVKLGGDPHNAGKSIDYGSTVEVGTVLAQIDNRLFLVHMEREQAGCRRAEAELAAAKVNLKRADALWQRAQRKQNGTTSNIDVEQARFDQEEAKASVAEAEAGLTQSKVALEEAKIALDNTTIKSPVKGVILDRRINVGQVVSANANGPSLFLIAADLDKLQVWASVNEADITRIHRGQPVHFTVDAFPSKVFEGKVEQIRLNAQMTQNTVTYTVVVAISSSKEKLLPYLTANLVFE
jgi:HlyD family secretion protein